MILRCFAATLICMALGAQERPLILKAARLLDVRTGKVESPAQIWIKGGRIQPGPPPADAETLDLGDRTLLPGLIDCHTHLLIPAGLGELGYLKRSQGAQSGIGSVLRPMAAAMARPQAEIVSGGPAAWRTRRIAVG